MDKPTNMVLVPREPTPEMYAAWMTDHRDWSSRYAAMLSAAPQPSLGGEVAGAVAAMGELAEHLDLTEGVYELEASVCRKVAVLLQSLSADNARLRESRGQAYVEIDNVSAAIGSPRWMEPPDGGSVSLGEQVNRMRADLEAAEARLSEAVEVLKPFAAFDTGPIEDDEFFHLPDTHPLLGEGLGDEWHSVVTIGDFRRARQFLDTQGGGNG